MPFNLIKFKEYSAQANAEARKTNPSIDPTIFGSLMRPLLTSGAALAYSLQQSLSDLALQLFPQTAEGEFIERWAAYEGLERSPATGASGYVSIGGVGTTLVPALTVFTSSDGIEYEAQAAATITDISQVIDSLTRSGTTVTATTSGDHTFATGIELTISGADQADYNGAFTVTATARNEFTYEISTSPVTPATGTMAAMATYASVLVQATEGGQATNQDGGAVLSCSVGGLDPEGYVQFEGLTGGADIESDESLRNRVILSRSIIEGVFTPKQVELAALSITGNTRAYVVRPRLSNAANGVGIEQDITSITRSGTTATVTTSGTHDLTDSQIATIRGADQAEYNGDLRVTVTSDTTFEYQVSGSPVTPATGTIDMLYALAEPTVAGIIPSPGQVAVYILRDGDANILPSSTVLANTKAAIISDGALPANTSEDDVFVLAPNPVEVDFTFTALTPNTATMQSAVRAQLEAFFEDNVDFETTVTAASYLGAIQNTQDLETGDVVQSFSLSSPSGDIVVADGEIAILGTVTF